MFCRISLLNSLSIFLYRSPSFQNCNTLDMIAYSREVALSLQPSSVILILNKTCGLNILNVAGIQRWNFLLPNHLLRSLTSLLVSIEKATNRLLQLFLSSCFRSCQNLQHCPLCYSDYSVVTIGIWYQSSIKQEPPIHKTLLPLTACWHGLTPGFSS